MSFFGFPSSQHDTAATGFSQAHDPFAGLANRNDDDDALEFDDTYDGLGDQLVEANDDFNDETFGGGGGGGKASASVGKDFDFFAQTAKVSNAIDEEYLRYNRHQPAARHAPTAQSSMPAASYPYGAAPAAKPAKSGYEKYKEPEPELQVDAALWGVAPKKPPAASQPAQPISSASRKVMSLEEVEAAMRAQTKKPTLAAQPTPPLSHTQGQYQAPYPPQQHAQHQMQHPTAYPGAAQHGDPRYGQPERSPGHMVPPSDANRANEAQHHGHGHPVTILQRPQSKHTPPVAQPGASPVKQQHHQARQQAAPVQPTQILQNPNRLSGDAARIGVQPHPSHPSHPTHHRQQSSFSKQAHIITHPSQMAQLSEEDKAAYLEQEAKRAKRNHKIFLLSKDNGIMTPQDKNFITRIQLQQLVSATGNPNEPGMDDSINEDFYYQVHTQIRGGQRQHPSQPLNNFAQTYLYQTGSRQTGMRRQNRGPENHMQRMEQQVQRAVEAAKNKPKNKQLVIEGSLGKISFSNAKTPKPLLNIKRTDSSGEPNRPGSAHKANHSANGGALDRKTVLRDIEQVYSSLMKMEDHDRKQPAPPTDESNLELQQKHLEWQEVAHSLNEQLWKQLKVLEPIGATPVHPFIAFLSFPKGKKAIPRVFRHTSHEQRTTILTMIVVHLDQLDIVRGAQINTGETHLNAALRENIELFSIAVMNSLFNFMNELELDIVSGVLGLISGLNLDLIAKTRIGVSMLTMILSRAELIRQSGGGNPKEWQTWEQTYNQFFNVLEPALPHIFPGTVTSGEDVYVWQFLAAIGIGANPDQQQRLVLAVKDRVMDTVGVAKTLPADLSTARLQSVNLFMRSIGLDVELLQ